jgi:hypothetical protein
VYGEQLFGSLGKWYYSNPARKKKVECEQQFIWKKGAVGSEDYIVNSVIVPLPTQDVTLVDFQGDQTTWVLVQYMRLKPGVDHDRLINF